MRSNANFKGSVNDEGCIAEAGQRPLFHRHGDTRARANGCARRRARRHPGYCGHRAAPGRTGAGRADRDLDIFGGAVAGARRVEHARAGAVCAKPDRTEQHGDRFGQRLLPARPWFHRNDCDVRSTRRHLRRRCLSEPPECEQSFAVRCRAGGGAAGAAGHPVRPQYDRRRDQRDHGAAGQEPEGLCRGRLWQLPQGRPAWLDRSAALRQFRSESQRLLAG
jgi:hypothetical protein